MLILLLEDQYKSLNTINFIRMIKNTGNDVLNKNRVPQFESFAKNNDIEMFIIDIMLSYEKLKNSLDENYKIPGSRAGLEIIKRIRQGNYNKYNAKSYIIVRSARTKESFIRNQCYEAGADICLSPGWDDDKIIDIIKEYKRKV